MHPITRWVEDDRVCLSSLFAEFSSKIFDFFILEMNICDTVFVRIFLSITTRTCDEFD